MIVNVVLLYQQQGVQYPFRAFIVFPLLESSIDTSTRQHLLFSSQIGSCRMLHMDFTRIQDSKTHRYQVFTLSAHYKTAFHRGCDGVKTQGEGIEQTHSKSK